MTSSDQLVSRVRAALDERERLPRDLTMDDDGVWSVERVGRVVDQYGREIAECTELGRVEADHIALHDPAAVLRLVASLREIVDAYEVALTAYGAAIGTVLAGAAKLRVATYEQVVRSLAHGLGIDLEES